MNSIKFRIAAKTDVGLVRENNEDNFQASSDLSIEPMRWVNNEICSLGDKGALLVVADGMGGMNAGEVASQIAIDTIRNAFSPENLTSEVMENRFSIEKYMNSVIVEADKQIKAEAKSHPESRGMGTTIVIGWLLDGKLYLSWCGDSRAYIYNPQAGLHQISKDHSYVQSLVDKGAISKEDAFDYPESNIVTRCLSDSPTKAKPESLLQPYSICDNDIIMLCTDGLSGMIRDNEIESIIRKSEHDMDTCSDLLIRAACDAEGADNITICMCQILQGADACNPEVFKAYDKRLAGPAQDTAIIEEDEGNGNKRLFGGIVLFLLIAGVLGFAYMNGAFSEKTVSAGDSTSVVKAKLVSGQTIAVPSGKTFTYERAEGEPQVGDKAYPNGSYVLEDKKIVIIKDGKIVSISEGEDDPKNQGVKEKEGTATEKTTGENPKKKDNGNPNYGPKKEEAPAKVPEVGGSVTDPTDNDKLTPIPTKNPEPEEIIHVVH